MLKTGTSKARDIDCLCNHAMLVMAWFQPESGSILEPPYPLKKDQAETHCDNLVSMFHLRVVPS